MGDYGHPFFVYGLVKMKNISAKMRTPNYALKGGGWRNTIQLTTTPVARSIHKPYPGAVLTSGDYWYTARVIPGLSIGILHTRLRSDKIHRGLDDDDRIKNLLRFRRLGMLAHLNFLNESYWGGSGYTCYMPLAKPMHTSYSSFKIMREILRYPKNPRTVFHDYIASITHGGPYTAYQDDSFRLRVKDVPLNVKRLLKIG